ncbi:hypothetical protein [Paenibacillus sp. FSL H7-0756]|uniref:hypothetical protein n=1 Tax=Paenibacillus sp. FSL H7-0756 TaxID=2954738 RepID=UPI0030FC52C6
MVKGKHPAAGDTAGCFCVVPGVGAGNTLPLAGETPAKGEGQASVSYTRLMIMPLAYDAGGKELDKVHLLSGNRPFAKTAIG